MTTAPLRKDAARNWHRIVEVGRGFVDDEVPLQLNDVAKAASVGVATVYRHFPTPEALLETLALPGLQSLAARAEQALAADDPWPALRAFLHAAIDAQLTDASIPPVFAAPRNVLPATADLKEHLNRLFGELLARARAAGTIDPSVTAADIAPLMCGVAFAAKVSPADRSATGHRYLDVLLDGLRARP